MIIFSYLLKIKEEEILNFYEKENISLYLDELDLLESMITPKQKIEIYQHNILGLVLVINGEIQHIERYQCIYHEQLVHLPISFCECPQTALVLGGGSLFAAHELLKYPSMQTVTLCDHDYTVLNLMEKYYDHAKIVLTDKRFYFVESDGVEFLASNKKNYDIIINDCFNLLKESNTYGFSFFKKMNDMLTNNGVCSDIIYRHIFDGTITHDSIREIKKCSKIALSLVTVPEYPGILHIQAIWGKNKNIAQTCKSTFNLFQKQNLETNNSLFNFYSPQNLPYYLYLPPYIKAML